MSVLAIAGMIAIELMAQERKIISKRRAEIGSEAEKEKMYFLALVGPLSQKEQRMTHQMRFFSHRTIKVYS